MNTITRCLVCVLALGFFGSAQTPTAPKTRKPGTTATKPKAPTTGTRTVTPPKTQLTTEKAKASYALGLNVGSSFKRQSIDIDPDIVAKGLHDAYTGAAPLLNETEATAALSQLKNQTMAKQQGQMAELGAKNKAEGEQFLAQNKAKEGIVTLPSGLQYKVLQQGTGPKPTASDVVVCNYRGTLLNGTEFDSSYKRGQPASFPVSGVIKGWTEALQLMPVGSKYQLFIPADLAYGDRGAGGGEIPPSATLIFEVELVSIEAKK
jgi:FKBP-type peptidyl-prolyl cis-trans isomerase FklB